MPEKWSIGKYLQEINNLREIFYDMVYCQNDSWYIEC